VAADDVLQHVRRPSQRHRGRTDPTVARALLAALDLSSAPSTFAQARDPPQAELAWEEPA